MKIKWLLPLLAFSFTVSSVKAQDYENAVGFRGGWFNGLTFKHFVNSNAAVEGILLTRWQGIAVVGLYEIHKSLGRSFPVNVYYGAGGHAGVWHGNNVSWAQDPSSFTVIGVDAILGFEYNFDMIPINISADWKPAYNLFGHRGFWAEGGAFSVRYIF